MARPLPGERRGETGDIEQAVAASGPDHHLRSAAGVLRRPKPRPIRGHRQSAQPSHRAVPRAAVRPDLSHCQREETRLSADRSARALTATCESPEGPSYRPLLTLTPARAARPLHRGPGFRKDVDGAGFVMAGTPTCLQAVRRVRARE